MSTAPLEQAIEVAGGVIANVDASQLSAPTPCASWDVAALIDHMVGGQVFFAAAVNGQPPSDEPVDAASGDFGAAFAAASSDCVAAFQSLDDMNEIVKAPFGEMPAQAFMGLAMTDTFQHAWDLAKATGQDTDLAPGMAEMLLAASQQNIQDNFRGPEGAPFGAEQTASDDAPAADRLAAFLGRAV
jgi:uncharacterized protein (TIGR03086 family)